MLVVTQVKVKHLLNVLNWSLINDFIFTGKRTKSRVNLKNNKYAEQKWDKNRNLETHSWSRLNLKIVLLPKYESFLQQEIQLFLNAYANTSLLSIHNLLLSINSLLLVCLSCYETFIISCKHLFIYIDVFFLCFLKSSVQIKWEMKKNANSDATNIIYAMNSVEEITDSSQYFKQTRHDAFKDSMRHHGWNAIFSCTLI